MAQPQDWPGATSVIAQLEGRTVEGTWFDRTEEYEATRCGRRPSKYAFASQEEMALHPLPIWDGLDDREILEQTAEIVREITARTRTNLRTRGRKPLGSRRLQRQHPHSRPASSKRSPAPHFHAASHDVRRALESGLRLFRIIYRQAAEELRKGNVAVKFPDNCFPSRRPFVRGPTYELTA